MDFEPFQKIPRFSRWCFVTEKIDGTNGQIFIPEETDLAEHWMMGRAFLVGSRKRWITPDDDNHGFARWAYENEEELLKLGPGRHYGEWWGQGIQRGYGLKEKRFSLFNTHRWNDDAVRPKCCHVVPTIAVGMFDSDVVADALNCLRHDGSYAAPGFMKPEGVVIYHVAGNLLFKKTIEGDEAPKGGQP